MIGVIGAFGIFFFLLALGSPIFIAFFLGSSIGFWMVRGYGALWTFYSHGLHDILSHYHFAVLPMFILLGTLAESGRLGLRAYETFHKLVGHVRGGVLVATTYAAAAFGAVSGASVASAALFTKIALPELRKYKYQEEISLGCIATAGSLAMLIPPSAMMVIFGVLTETSVGRLLIGGIIPGIVLATLLAISIYIRAKLNPEIAPVLLEPVPWRERTKSVLGIWPVGLVAITILASIYTGMVTPSEAGAVGAMIVLLWNFIARVHFKEIANAFCDASITTGKILVLIVGGILFGRVVAYSGVTKVIIAAIAEANLPLVMVWALIILVWIVLGMVLEAVALLVLTLPFVFPVMTGLGVDPVVLGIVTIVMVEMAVITPPVGFNCYVVASIAGVDPVVVFRGIFPFCIVLLIAVIIFILFPDLSTWLPNMAFGKSLK